MGPVAGRRTPCRGGAARGLSSAAARKANRTRPSPCGMIRATPEHPCKWTGRVVGHSGAAQGPSLEIGFNSTEGASHVSDVRFARVVVTGGRGGAGERVRRGRDREDDAAAGA